MFSLGLWHCLFYHRIITIDRICAILRHTEWRGPCNGLGVGRGEHIHPACRFVHGRTRLCCSDIWWGENLHRVLRSSRAHWIPTALFLDVFTIFPEMEEPTMLDCWMFASLHIYDFHANSDEVPLLPRFQYHWFHCRCGFNRLGMCSSNHSSSHHRLTRQRVFSYERSAVVRVQYQMWCLLLNSVISQWDLCCHHPDAYSDMLSRYHHSRKAPDRICGAERYVCTPLAYTQNTSTDIIMHPRLCLAVIIALPAATPSEFRNTASFALGSFTNCA